IGTPFDDVLDGANGSDTYTGGPGYDTFADSSPVTDTDTLIETNDSDMGLYGNLFVVGTIYADDGVTAYATDAGNLISQQAMIDAVKTRDDPSFRTTGWADRYSGSSVGETI